MVLPNDLISKFVKITRDDKKTKTETTVYGTIVESNGAKYVRFDGADENQLTPAIMTVDAEEGERVSVLIKDHTATVTGNISSPAARVETVEVVTETVEAQNGKISKLESDNVVINETLTAHKASMEEIEADNVKINEGLTAVNADIKKLETDKLSVKDADLKYANIDFTNIGTAAMEYFYARSGLIKDVTVGDQTITGELVGVTIKGDLIEGNTIKAEKLVIRGDDGLFYKLNTDGLSVIDEGNVFNKDNCYPEGNVTNVEWIDNYGATVTTNGSTELLAMYFALDPEKTYVLSYEGENCEVGMYGLDWTEIFRSADDRITEQVITGAHHCYFAPPVNSDQSMYTFRNVRIIEKEVYDKNRLDGSIISAKSITATKISVSDLVAFGATIGGFHITDDSIYSGAKEYVDNTTRGIYLNNEGEFAFGDSSNFIKYLQDDEGNWHLNLAVDSLRISGENTSIGGRNLYLGTRNFDGDNWANLEHWETWDPDGFGYREYGRYGAWLGLGQYIDVKAGETYTFSFYARGDANSEVTIYNTQNHTETYPGSLYIGHLPDVYTRYHFTFVVNEDCTICPRVENMTEDGWIQIYGLKLERGSVATDWSPAPEDAESSIEEAGKTATNFIEYDSDDGLQIGNKTGGTWSGFRAQITAGAYNILNAAGAVLASYGEKLIELGKNATDAVIKFCGGKGQIEYVTDEDDGDEYIQMSSDKVRIKSTEKSSVYSMYTDNSTRWEKSAVNVTPSKVELYASECIDPGAPDNADSWQTTKVTLNSGNVTVDTPGATTFNGTGVYDSHGKLMSVVRGSSGIWTYSKWSDGTVDLWGTYHVYDQACTNVLGSMYRTHVFQPDDFPFLVYNPQLTASYETSGYGAMLWATTTTTVSAPPSYYLIRPVSGTITYGKIIFHVTGTWV